MIWLALEHSEQNALYLDIHHVEQNRDGAASRTLFSGTLGDGCNEGEVLIELGSHPTVTFADMLPDSGLRPLIRFHGETALKQALLQACQPLAPRISRRIDPPHCQSAVDSQLHLFGRCDAPVVAESQPVWSSTPTESADAGLNG